jgi:hypothetical protein
MAFSTRTLIEVSHTAVNNFRAPTFSSLMSSAEKEIGLSIASKVKTWRRSTDISRIFMQRGLKLTILHDISNDAKLVEVSSSSFSAKRLFEDDLDVINVMAVPSSIEERVSEPQNQQILDHLFTQIVVNAEDLILSPIRG